MSALRRRKRRRGFRLDDYVVERLAPKRKQYTVWDLAVEGCGVRVSSSTKACVISVRIGQAKKFETIGRIAPDSPYEYLRELAMKRIGELKRERLPTAPRGSMGSGDSETLRQALEAYIAAHPELSDRTMESYRKDLERALPLQMDQPARLLIATEILRLNKERLEELSRRDPVNKPPKGFWSWQLILRTLRTVLCWRAAQKEQPSPWPDQRALKIKSAPARELPVELQSVEGRRRLIEGLKAIDSPLARGCQFICYTGLRRRAAASLSRDHLIANGVLEFKSKTRMVRVPLSRQAAALIDPQTDAGLLHVGDKRLKEPLVKIFGERLTSRGKRARVTPHDLRRYFKSVGTELGIDPTIMNLLVGHTVKGVDKHYIAKLRLTVLRAAAQRIADEIENPQDISGDEAQAVVAYASPPKPHNLDAYLFNRELPPINSLKPTRHAHYFTREDLYRSVWTAPVSEVAARLGISDVGLAKACRRAAIPLPPRGYWARVASGQQVIRAPLPTSPAEFPKLIRVRAPRQPIHTVSAAA
jgi:integrase